MWKTSNTLVHILSVQRKILVSVKPLAWSTCHRKKRVWKSNLSRKLKVRFFKSNVEAVLLYGCEACIVDKALTKKMLQMLWMLHMYAAHGTEYLKKAETYWPLAVSATTKALRNCRIKDIRLTPERDGTSLYLMGTNKRSFWTMQFLKNLSMI